MPREKGVVNTKGRTGIQLSELAINYGLTEQEAFFCVQFSVHYNRIEAAIEAGYSRSWAKSHVNTLTSRQDIQACLLQLILDRQNKAIEEADEVSAMFKAVALANMADYVEQMPDTGEVKVKSINEIGRHKMQAVKKLVTKKRMFKDGTEQVETVIELHDKLRAGEVDLRRRGKLIDKIELVNDTPAQEEDIKLIKKYGGVIEGTCEEILEDGETDSPIST